MIVGAETAMTVLLGLGWLTAGIGILGAIALVVGIWALVSVLRNPDLSGGAKAMWVVAIILLPLLGAAVYAGVRSDW
jgi:hypothetical protein